MNFDLVIGAYLSMPLFCRLDLAIINGPRLIFSHKSSQIDIVSQALLRKIANGPNSSQSSFYFEQELNKEEDNQLLIRENWKEHESLGLWESNGAFPSEVKIIIPTDIKLIVRHCVNFMTKHDPEYKFNYDLYFKNASCPLALALPFYHKCWSFNYDMDMPSLSGLKGSVDITAHYNNESTIECGDDESWHYIRGFERYFKKITGRRSPRYAGMIELVEGTFHVVQLLNE